MTPLAAAPSISAISKNSQSNIIGSEQEFPGVGRMNSQSRISQSNQSPFTSQKKKSHQQAMLELSVIAKDLENYNKNKYFNERARSMMAPSYQTIQPVGAVEQTSQYENRRTPSQLLPKDLINQNSNLKVGQEEVSEHSSSIQERDMDEKQRTKSNLLFQHNQRSLDEQTMAQQLRAFQSQLMARDDTNRHDKIRLRNLANSRTPQGYRQQLSRLKNEGSLDRIQKNLSVERLQNPNNRAQNSNEYDMKSSSSPYHQHMRISEHMGPQITIDQQMVQSPMASLEGTSKLDISLPRGSRNALRNQFSTDVQKNYQKASELGNYLIDGQSAELSAILKHKILGDSKFQAARNDAHTAAQSISIENTLERDGSRQFLDVNFSIGDNQTNQPRNQGQQSQMLQHNMSLSQVSQSIGNYSDAHAMGNNQGSLYNDNVGVRGRNKGTNNFKMSLSASVRKPSDNWKQKRRQSEQTRINEQTGLTEQIDLLQAKKNTYLAMKRKYAGKDSGMAQLARREAENIQKQRERINELKDFKSMMKNLKQSDKQSSMNESGLLRAPKV